MLGAVFSFFAGMSFMMFYNSVTWEFIESTPFLGFLWFILFGAAAIKEAMR